MDPTEMETPAINGEGDAVEHPPVETQQLAQISSENEDVVVSEDTSTPALDELEASDREETTTEVSAVDPEMLRLASEAAIQNAVDMKRSDSILSTESNDSSHSSESSIGASRPPVPTTSPAPLRGISRASVRYMEEASFEAAMLSPGTHKVAPSGKLRRLSTDASGEIVRTRPGTVVTETKEDEDQNQQNSFSTNEMSHGSMEPRTSERAVFRSNSSLRSDANIPLLDTIISMDAAEELEDEEPENDVGTIASILQTIGIEFDSLDGELPQEALLLHKVFDGFCTPPLEVEAVWSILKSEQGQDTDIIRLPMDVVIRKPSQAMRSLLGPRLLMLPNHWARAFLRILLRLFTGESDIEYQSSVLQTCPWYEETFKQEKSDLEAFLTRPRTSSVSSLQRQTSLTDQSLKRINEAQKTNLKYSMVRFQRGWTTAHKQLLDIIEKIGQHERHLSLEGPIIRLLGLISTSGIAVDELRRMLRLATSANSKRLTALHLTRAIRIAADGASRSSTLVGKASPISFFSFSSGPGIVRSINLEKSSWPFKNDSGMALWFRPERIDSAATLLKIANGNGDGTELSIAPLKGKQGSAKASVLSFSIIEGGNVVNKIELNSCILHERVWYHVSFRHTRSRMKGVFSLGSREQLSIMLDGKSMLKESINFPQMKDANCKSLTVTFGANFEGQTGALYIFNENVSDATLRALYEFTAGTNATVPSKATSPSEWESRHSAIVRKSKILGLSMQHDDVEHLVLSKVAEDSGDLKSQFSVVDLPGDDDASDTGSLSKSAFMSRLFLAWDPRRTEDTVALEVHIGAHARMKPECVQAWILQGVQDVLGSIGGMQAVLPLIRTALSGEHEERWSSDVSKLSSNTIRDRCIACGMIPELFQLLAALVRDHGENGREMLRSGTIDILEQSLQQNKRRAEASQRFPASSLMAATFIFPGLSAQIVESLRALQEASSHYVGLETKVFSRLIFNVPLWLTGASIGCSNFAHFLPLLSSAARTNPKKVRDCVGVKEIVQLVVQLAESENDGADNSEPDFERDDNEWSSLCSPLNANERQRSSDILMAILFEVWRVGSAVEEISFMVSTLSKYLEYEWELASHDKSHDVSTISRQGLRLQRYNCALKLSTLLHLLLQIKPSPPNFLENFVLALGGAQSCISWILSALVNSYCDRIRAVGIRCAVLFIEATSRGPDSPLAIDVSDVALGEDGSKQEETFSFQENTMALISNVGQGIMNSNVGKGLAAMGPSGLKRGGSSVPVTARIVYKLLWHLLKSQRYHIDVWTQASLKSLVFERTVEAKLKTMASVREELIVPDEVLDETHRIELAKIEPMMQNVALGMDPKVRDIWGLNILLRLLRFLPEPLIDQWLSDFIDLSARSTDFLEAVSTTQSWQPCLFQLVSEATESITSKRTKFGGEDGGDQAMSSDGGGTSTNGGNKPIDENSVQESMKRLDSALELYASLLAFKFRQSADIALATIEEAASLQRVCLNGQQVFILLLTKLYSNLHLFGVLSMETLTATSSLSDGNNPSVLLKKSAKLVTDALSSSSKRAISSSAASGHWRCVRYLSMVCVYVITKCGFGVAELSDPESRIATSSDGLSGGLFGLRLDDIGQGEIQASELLDFYSWTSLVCNATPSDRSQEKDVNRRLCVRLAAQVLSLLDAFVFPDHIELGQKASQLHGLSLVRNPETRIGVSQGPLLASLIRLSLLLLGSLEPSSQALLQCSSRLRCYVHWMLHLIRESEALEGYSAAFNKPAAVYERLLLAIFLQTHRTLWRCKLLSIQMESTPFEENFKDKEAWKNSYRQLLRVCVELSEVLYTILQDKGDIIRQCIRPKPYEAFKKAIQLTRNEEGKGGNNMLKEDQIHSLLASEWVSNFQGAKREGNTIFPEQVLTRGSDKGAKIVQDLFVDTREIESAFEASLNKSFEDYLERQRMWAETGAVRDLEFEGDTVLKSQSSRFLDVSYDKQAVELAFAKAASKRWYHIQRSVVMLWEENHNWMLDPFTDRLGKRVALVRNQHFDMHTDASYDLMMGLAREQGEKEKEERRRKKELAQLMKRNSEAFVPLVEQADADADESEVEGEGDLDGNDSQVEADDGHVEIEENENIIVTEKQNVGKVAENEQAVQEEENMKVSTNVKQSGSDVDTDLWAKTFVWLDGESVVARFENVMIVSLQYHMEGKLLLTTHGIYFHQVGEKINSITKETFTRSEGSDQDSRWRLSRLSDVLGRRYMLRSQALELFFVDGRELFMNFVNGSKHKNRFYAKLRNSCKIPVLFSFKSLNPRTIFGRSRLTELWRKRLISNFDYLMALNRMAGRTFNDIAQYPVFPWILADYSSDKIDLSDSRVYRDLTKPVGALNPDRLSMLIERYNELEQFGFSENEKFLYGSHYSSPGIILHFLIRQEPFTSMAIDLQSGRFDCPDRLFFDLKETWRSCNTSSSDVKELIPECFTLPEMFLNQNKFPLGTTQRGYVVGDVGLPPWAKGSAHEFVRVHRLALESEYVSRNLHHWIDLVFGFKQRGREAEAAHNIFHHLSYEGAVDLDKISDELDRQAAESHIQNFGQTPSQLLTKESHPQRLSSETCWQPLVKNMSAAVSLKCHTPAHQFGAKGGHGSATHVHVQGETLSVVYSDYKVGTFKWNPKAAKNRLKPDKVRAFPSKALGTSRAALKRGYVAPKTLDDSRNSRAVGAWSFAITVGGYEKEQLRRKALVPSRLATAKDALYSEAASLVVSTGYWDNTIRVHSADSMKLEASSTGGHRGPIRCIAVGSDGGLMVSGGEDCTVRVWVVDHPDMAVALSDGYAQTAIGHSIDGDQVLSCCHVLFGHETPVTCVAVSCDLDIVASGSIGGKICIHKPRGGTFVRSITPPVSSREDCAVLQIALDKYGRMVVHLADNSLHTYTVNGELIASTNAGERIHDMIITEEVLISGGDRCHVYIRKMMTLKVVSGLDLSRHGPIRSLAMSPGDYDPLPQHLFIGSNDGMISIVDREDSTS